MIAPEIERFLSFIREAQQLSRIAEANEQEANDETQDALHILELKNLSYHETAKLAKKLRETRQNRRAAKDLRERTQPLLEWAESNKGAIKELERVLGNTRRIESNMKHRMYTPKTEKYEELLGQ